MGDANVKRRRIRGDQDQRALTPAMLWPVSGEAPGTRVDQRGIQASRMAHPSVRARRLSPRASASALPEPRLILGGGRDFVDLSECGNRCGSGMWCEACRADIRSEALRWLRELNVVRAPGTTTALAWSRAWSHEVLLADH